MKQYDVIIAGAGIAGLMSARTLQENNITNFLCFDRKKEVGYPLKCGEGVDKESFDAFFGENDYPFIRNRINKNIFFYHGKKKIHERTFHMDYYQVDRPQFEQWMAEPVKDKIRCSEGVQDIIPDGDGWSVVTTENTYHTKSVILAYGCSFDIQLKLGMTDHAPKVCPFYLGIFKAPSLPNDEFRFHYFPDLQGGLWEFPKGDGTVNIGVGAVKIDDGKGTNLKTYLERFLKKHVPDAECLTPASGVLPLEGAIPHPVKGTLLACGDAAGFVHPFSGEGIQYALRSGTYAAETLVSYLNGELKDCSLYTKRCLDDFGLALEMGASIKRRFEWAYHHMPERIPTFLKLPNDNDIRALKTGKLTLRLKLARKLVKS